MSEPTREVKLTETEVAIMANLLFREEEVLADLRGKLDDLDFDEDEEE